MNIAKRIFEYLAERLSSLVIICLSFTVAVLATLLFYVTVPAFSPILQKERAENLVTALVETSDVDVALFVQINLETNSRKFVASAEKSVLDKPLVLAFKQMAENTKFTAGTNPNFIYSLISGKVICQDKNDINPIVLRIIQGPLKDNPTTKICTVPVLNASQVLIGYVAVLWKQAPTPEKELAVLVQVQSELRPK